MRERKRGIQILSLACFSLTFHNPMTPKQNIKYMVKIDLFFSLSYNLIFELHLKNAKKKQKPIRESQLHGYRCEP